jgi:hypothetical protein
VSETRGHRSADSISTTFHGSIAGRGVTVTAEAMLNGADSNVSFDVFVLSYRHGCRVNIAGKPSSQQIQRSPNCV